MREDVKAVLIDLYGKARRWQTEENNIQFALTFEEYVSLWSTYRILILGDRIDNGTLQGYLNNPHTKPVCGWTHRDEFKTGVMHRGNAQILMAKDSLKMFQFVAGDRHTEETKMKMRKPKSEKTKAKMREAAKNRWAKHRTNNAG